MKITVRITSALLLMFLLAAQFISCSGQSAPVTTETEKAPETTAEQTEAGTGTEAETAAETEAPTEKTAKPKILGTTMLSENKALIYGSTVEDGAMIRTIFNGKETKNRSKGKYFYIEVDVESPGKAAVYATEDGKLESNMVRTNLSPGEGTGQVWGGRDSRLFYTPTLEFLTGNRADEAVQTTIDQMTGFITNKTIKDIQSLTGKKTKLMYVVIPDPATAYCLEHLPYVQDSVQDPSTSLMEAFVKTLDGKNEDVYAIDLMPTMRAHKDEYIYFSTDTHYTELGAYYAYLEIMKRVKNDYPETKVRTVEDGDYSVEYLDVAGGDMCGMAGLGMNEIVPFFIAQFKETGTYYHSKRNDGIRSAGFGPSGWRRDSEIKSDNPTAYFLGDSYGCYILPFIGANFSKLCTNEGVFWNYTLERDILSENQPDYVILLICQRNIDGNFLGNVISQFSMSLG